jgi:WD40 repeat protein
MCATTAAAQNDKPMILRGHSAGVTAVRFSPDDKWIASSSLDGTVRLWSWPAGKTIRVFRFGPELYDVAVSPNGRLVAGVGDSRTVVIWNTSTGALLRQITLPFIRSLAVAFVADEVVIVGSGDGKVRAIDVASGRIQREITAGQEIFAVAASREGRYLASGLPLAVWDRASGVKIASPRGFAQGDVAFSSDGRWLASGEYTGGARLFSMPSGELKSRLPTNEEKRVQGMRGTTTIDASMPVTAVTFSPDSRMLATAGGDRRIELWALSEAGAEEKPRRVLEGHSMTVTGISFSSTGESLASGGLDRTVRVWRVGQGLRWRNNSQAARSQVLGEFGG